MELDNLDRRILMQFDVDAGVSFTKLARRLRTTRQVLEYRIKKLIRRGLIRKFYSVLNFSGLGFWQYMVYTKLRILDQEKESEMVDFLVKNENVMWLAKYRGRFDLIYILLAKDPGEFAAIQNTINERFGSNIRERYIVVSEHSVMFTRPFIIDETEKNESVHGKIKLAKKRLSKKDEKILKVITEDGLASSYRIAEKTGLPPNVVYYRLRRMKKNGLITAINADVDLKKAGLSSHRVFIRLNNHSSKLFGRIEGFSRQRKSIVHYLKSIGPWDVELEYVVKDTDQLERELKSLRNEFSTSIRDYEVTELCEEKKFSYFPFKSV